MTEMTVYLGENWNEHLEDTLVSLVRGLSSAVLTPGESPDKWSEEYLRLLERHLDNLLMMKAKNSGRTYVATTDLTEKQNASYTQAKHLFRILDALYGPKED